MGKKKDFTELFKETYFASYDDAWDSADPAALWLNAPRLTILLMTSVMSTRKPASSPTTSCNTTHLSVGLAGSKLTLWRKDPLDQTTSKKISPTVTTTVSSSRTRMAARCTVAMAPCLVKT